MELYKPFKNNTNSKYKFFVYVKADNKKGFKKIGFGDKNYQDFRQHKDKVRQASYLRRAKGFKKIGFGNKNYLDFTQHKDPERRRRYLARAKGIKDKEGNLTYKNKNSANYFSVKYLWNG